MELFVVHEGVQAEHYSSERLFRVLGALPAGEIISDRMAQTIAAWWHSPDSPLSTVLSTMGKVDRRMNRETFATDAQRAVVDDTERSALDALVKYIEHHIASAPSSYRPCACDDCGNLLVGIVGDMCDHCEEAKCEYGEECGVEYAYTGCEEDCNH